MGDVQTAQGTLLGTNKFGTDDADWTYLFTPPQAGRHTVDAQLFHLFNWNLQNRSGATALVGLGVHFNPRDWVAGLWTDSTTTYTDDTVDAQDAGTSDFPLETRVLNNDGHVVAAVRPFNLIGYSIGTAGLNTPTTAVTRDLAYSAPTGWTTIAGYWVGPPTGVATWSTGERAVCFPMPPDFTPLTVALHGTGVPEGKYGVRMRATTAPTQAAAATQVVVGRIVDALEGVADNGSFTKGSDQPYICQGANLAMLVSADTDAANAANAAGSHGVLRFRLQG